MLTLFLNCYKKVCSKNKLPVFWEILIFIKKEVETNWEVEKAIRQ